MKRRRAGLICAGGIAQSFLARMPSVLATIGPVAAGSFRVAGRMANLLRAGHAVEDYAALEDCELIWIAVPESALNDVTREAAARPLLREKHFIVCDSARDSTSLAHLRGPVATLNGVGPDNRFLVAEGDADLIRRLRRIAEEEGRKLIELRPNSKALFLAGVHLATDLMLPCISGAVESLRAAGFSRAEATGIAQSLGSQTLRAYVKAGRRAWGKQAARELRDSIESGLASIRAADARLAGLYAAGIEQALRYFES